MFSQCGNMGHDKQQRSVKTDPLLWLQYECEVVDAKWASLVSSAKYDARPVRQLIQGMIKMYSSFRVASVLHC